MTATENSGSPIIGRITSRSITSPRRTATTSADSTSAENHDDVVVVAQPATGMRQSTSSIEKNHAPTSAIAPWAKLTVWVALKIEHEPERDERVDRARRGRGPACG